MNLLYIFHLDGNNIFNIFYSGDGNIHGAGLGLLNQCWEWQSSSRHCRMMLCPVIIWLADLCKTLQDDVMSSDHLAGSPPQDIAG